MSDKKDYSIIKLTLYVTLSLTIIMIVLLLIFLFLPATHSDPFLYQVN